VAISVLSNAHYIINQPNHCITLLASSYAFITSKLKLHCPSAVHVLKEMKTDE
jgi:hypothetical protein